MFQSLNENTFFFLHFNIKLNILPEKMNIAARFINEGGKCYQFFFGQFVIILFNWALFKFLSEVTDFFVWEMGCLNVKSFSRSHYRNYKYVESDEYFNQ